jgi:putative ABC transport system substrate-binding protein
VAGSDREVRAGRAGAVRVDDELSRRVLLALVAVVAVSLLCSPLAGETQSTGKASARIGFIGNSDPKTQAASVEALRQGFRDLGWIEWQNLSIEYRWAEGNLERFPVFAAEFVRLRVDVIMASGTPSIRAVQQATSTIPIVCVLLVDPVQMGFAASLARPGGNITGVASQYEEIVTKQVQLLAEAVPKLSRVVLVRHKSVGQTTVRPAAAAAEKLGIKAQIVDVGDVVEYENAFRAARDDRAQALLVLRSPIFNANRRVLIKLAESYRLPTFYEFRSYVEDGGLISYGPSIEDMFRRAASYVDRVLNGAKPGDLPFERPTKFELVINRRTAKELGLTIPRSLLIRADQLID